MFTTSEREDDGDDGGRVGYNGFKDGQVLPTALRNAKSANDYVTHVEKKNKYLSTLLTRYAILS